MAVAGRVGCTVGMFGRFGQIRAMGQASTCYFTSSFLARGSVTDRAVPGCAQISAVVWMFSYPLRTALAVGLSMAQIGEFAFVLLSVASHQGLLAYQVYMLLMGAHRPLLRHTSLPVCILCAAVRLRAASKHVWTRWPVCSRPPHTPHPVSADGWARQALACTGH